MTEKQKKFRVHVVKEIFDTERDYTRSLEFTVTYILEKAREKERNPIESTFTADNIKTLFCNIEEILDVHRKLMADLEATMASKGPVYETAVAACYLKHKAGFQSYKKYGENNEQAQKLFYELQEQQSFKAFFYGCMLLGGKGEEEISAYFFKPIQRVCKYPLLFRELEKYTPPNHPDYQATQDALAMMRETCSTINEAKRRVEQLEAIADWQATVEQWEGPNVVDTCNVKIKEGPLIKISAGNTQERQFYLFDNLLVYCKKKGRNGAVFRGRISMEGLEVEDIQDGTADFHSNGLTVVNGWKVHNIAKDKWFVLLAKTQQEKQEWMEIFRREKEKKKRVAAGIAQATRDLMVTKGERFYNLMLGDNLIKDHRVRLRTYQNTFTGQEMVQWLIKRKEAGDVDEAIILGQALVDNGLMHHVNDKHQFKNTPDLVYRFRYDDKTYKGQMESSDIISRGIRVYCRLHGLFDPLLKDQRVGVGRTTLYCVINSQRMIDWWCEEKDICNRAEGVTIGKEFYATGIMKHATDPSQNFKDAAEFYRFTADDGHEGAKEKDRKLTVGPTASKKNFGMINDTPCKTFTLLYSAVDQDYGVELGSQHPVIISRASQGAQICGIKLGQQVLAINGRPVTSQDPTEHFGALKVKGDAPPPLYLTVVRKSSEFAVLNPKGGSLGFNVKGSSPVVISGTDKGSAAALAGIIVSSCILKVGDQNVLQSTHEEVVSAVRRALANTAESDGGSKVSLKLSNPFMENLTSYSYESNDSATIDVYERLIESPYIFSIPAQLLQLYEEEMQDVIALVEGIKVTDTKVTDYLSGLKSIGDVYKKTIFALSGSRWPTYKVHGNPPPVALEACATNLHTSVLDVINSGTSTSFVSSYEELDNGLPPLPKTHTSYCISTMAVPCVTVTPVTKDDEVFKDVEIRRELLYTLRNHLRDMANEQRAVKRMIDELHPVPAHTMLPKGRLDIPNGGEADDLTPTNSPLLNRRRVVSVSNPEPMIKLMVTGVLQKVETFLVYLDDRLLSSVVEECDSVVKTTAQDEIKDYKARLKSLSEEVKVLAKRSLGEPLYRSTKTLVDTVQKAIQELSARIWVSIALCDKISLVQTVDKLFSQCLTSVVTAFGHHLVKAGRGHLNPGMEYEEDNWEASQQWLQLTSKKGVLLHMQSMLIPTKEKEFNALKDLKRVLSKVEKVKLFVKPEDKGEPHSLPLHYSDLPPVKLEGDRNEVHVTFFVPPSLFEQLPEGIVIGSGIKIIPVLFNRGLLDFQEGLKVFSEEKSLNTESFKKLKDYYQALRRFRLDRSNLPEESDAKCLAIHKISRPLNAMDLLMRQIEVAVKEPTRPGVGLLTIAAELATRMGALRVNICDSGVYRSSLATSLEQVMVLCRCHGLPFRSFRSALNTMRRKGSLIPLIRKNNADISTSLPKAPPKLYRIPPEPTIATT